MATRVFVITCALIANTAVVVYSYLGFIPYRRGCTNGIAPRIWLEAGLYCVLLGALATVIAATARGWRSKRNVERGFAVVSIALMLVGVRMTLITTCNDQKFAEGLSQWARGSVRGDAVRLWATSVSPAAGDVPSASWPSAVASLKPAPDDVAVVGQGGGLLLTWHAWLPTISPSRVVLVMFDAGAIPPQTVPVYLTRRRPTMAPQPVPVSWVGAGGGIFVGVSAGN